MLLHFILPVYSCSAFPKQLCFCFWKVWPGHPFWIFLFPMHCGKTQHVWFSCGLVIWASCKPESSSPAFIRCFLSGWLWLLSGAQVTARQLLPPSVLAPGGHVGLTTPEWLWQNARLEKRRWAWKAREGEVISGRHVDAVIRFPGETAGRKSRTM